MVCGYIYKIEFPNGKFYVGLTTRTLKERLKEHKRCAMNANETTKVLYNAIRKFEMIDTFELVEIDTAETQEELCKKEIDYIKKYDSYYNGYNMTFGGEGVIGYEYTEKDKQKMSESQKKRFENPEENKKLSDAHKKRFENPEEIKKISEAQKKRFENPEENKKLSDAHKKRFENPEEIKKNSEAQKKYHENNPEAGKLHGDKLKKYYENNPEAGKLHGDKLKKYYENNPEARKKNSEAQKKRFKDNPEAGKLHGDKLKKYYENNPEARQKCSEAQKKRFKDNPEARKKSCNYKPFDVFKKDGTYVKSFDYQFEAKDYLQETYGINGSNILTDMVLQGKRKSSLGFIFKYQVQFWV